MTEPLPAFHHSDIVVTPGTLTSPIPEWKQAIINWAIAIDETPTADPSEIASRLSLVLTGEHWFAAAHAMAETEAVADEAIGMMDIL